MEIFYLSILLTYISALVSRNVKYKVVEKLFYLLIPLLLILVSGLRNNIGDTYFYMHSYTLLDGTFDKFTFKGDFTFNAFQILLYKICSNPQFLIFMTACITNIFNFIVFYKYRIKNYIELQVFMYITSGYFFVSMNGIRQCLAASIVFLGTKFIIEGKFKKYLILVLFVSTIHNSAIMMIPVYFFVRTKAWSKKTWVALVVFIGAFLMYDKLMPIIYNIMGDSTYTVYQDSTEGGSSFLRVIIMSVPTILAFINRKKLEEIWPESNVFVNISLLSIVFTTFGMYNWIFNRITLYFQLYNMILMPYIIRNCHKGKERRLLYFGFVICYFLFCYMEQDIGMNLQYKSDYLNILNMFY